MTDKGQVVVSMILTILFVSSLSSVIVFEASANPIVIYLEQTYGYLVLDSNMSMPEAFVNFTIEPTQGVGKWVTYDIWMNGSYTFLSPDNQQATIGLACPTTWFSNSSEVQIFDNQTVIPHEIIPYEELVSENETQTAGWESLDFITFNCTLVAGIPLDVSVTMNLETRNAENGFTFYYFVATAHAWNGTTHEVIIMNMKNPTVLNGCSFWPNDHLTVNEDSLWTSATWDLNMSEFEWDYVSFTAMHKDAVIEIITDPVVVGTIVTVCAVVLIVAVYVLRGRRPG
ncbi:MAG: hypothetical protein ACFFFK_02010 [Candidatus Thorarchaeota archaeon]